jgi:hypothetical protein
MRLASLYVGMCKHRFTTSIFIVNQKPVFGLRLSFLKQLYHILKTNNIRPASNSLDEPAASVALSRYANKH